MASKEMVIDSSIFIDYLRAKNKSKTILQNLPDDAELFISSVTLYELYIGATTQLKLVDIKNLTDNIPVLAFDQGVSERAALIYHDLRKSNKMIEFRDIFIAGTCLYYDLPVLTLNTKHFKRVKGVQLIET